jgi:vacuolar-type H+-ATPase subunit H
MAANRKELADLNPAAARGRLNRLLETETELDEMLRETRRMAAELIASARAEAEERTRKLETELHDADLELRARIDRERDEAIANIRAEAERERDQLDALEDRLIDELAAYVVERVVGHGPEGRP